MLMLMPMLMSMMMLMLMLMLMQVPMLSQETHLHDSTTSALTQDVQSATHSRARHLRHDCSR
jgi:hypothetical protein